MIQHFGLDAPAKGDRPHLIPMFVRLELNAEARKKQLHHIAGGHGHRLGFVKKEQHPVALLAKPQ